MHFYCSKCTITLVQQGFIVEQLTPKDLEQYAKNANSKGSLVQSPSNHNEHDDHLRKAQYLKQPLQERMNLLRKNYTEFILVHFEEKL